MAESKWYCDACGARIDKRDVAAIRADAETLAALRSALFDEYGINVVDEALLVAIASPSEMEVNRERWQAARDRLRAALAATPAEEES